MKVKCKIVTEVEIPYVKCYLFARYWEDADVSLNGSEFESVNEDGSNMPQSMFLDYSPEITSYKGFKDDKCFYMKINPETGQIENWEKGYAMHIHWKVVDQGVYRYYDDKDNIIKNLDCEYVPDYLAIEDSGYGDYVIMNVDENGFINNWNKNEFASTLKNILNNEED